MSEKDEGNIMVAMQIILRTIEDFKITVLLSSDNQDVFNERLNILQKAVSILMNKVVDNEEVNVKTTRKIELIDNSINILGEKIEKIIKIHSDDYKLELSGSKGVLKRLFKIYKKDDISLEDIKEVKEIYENNKKDIELLTLTIECYWQCYLDHNDEQILNDVLEIININDALISTDSFILYRKALFLSIKKDKLDAIIDILLQSEKTIDSINLKTNMVFKNIKIYKHNLYFTMSSVYATNDKFVEALKYSILSIENVPECPNGWLNKGKILYEMKNLPEALGCVEKSLEIDPKQSEAWFFKAVIQMEISPTFIDNAIQSMKTSITLDKTIPETHFILGDLLISKGKFEDAITSLDKGLLIDPTDECANCKKMEALIKIGDLDNAEKIFQNLLKSVKCCPYIINSFSWFLLEKGKINEAYERIIKIDFEKCEEGPIWDTYACILYEKNELDDSLNAFNKALKYKKSDTEISWNILYDLYIKMSMDKNAEEIKSKYIKENKNDS